MPTLGKVKESFVWPRHALKLNLTLGMTLERLKHSAILSTLFKMTDDVDVMGASEFIKGRCITFSNLPAKVCNMNS